jgi:hypothetical protein
MSKVIPNRSTNAERQETGAVSIPATSFLPAALQSH